MANGSNGGAPAGNGGHFSSFTNRMRDLSPYLMLALSGLVWGMKLEGRYDRLEERQTEIKTELAELHTRVDADGAWVYAHKEETKNIKRDLDRIEREVEELTRR